MRKKYKIEDLSFTNDAIFSEIDLKETSFKKKKDIELYSLNVLSDTELDENEFSDNESNESNNSINLDDYDLDIDVGYLYEIGSRNRMNFKLILNN